MGHTISVFPERESLVWLVSELLLIEILSGNVAAISENVGRIGPTGCTGWLIIAFSWEVSSVVEEVMDLSRLLTLLSENVAAFSENVAWLGPAGWTEWLTFRDESGVEEELVALASSS